MERDIDRTAIAEFSEELIREYQCESISEKSLCNMVASAYFNSMRASKGLQLLYSQKQVSSEKNGYFQVMSKELEKQQRIYIHALQTLRAFKSPVPEISIRAKNAFIANHQELHNHQNAL